jgi:acetoin utilization deacetylase AcuC-like enzyme
MQPHRARIAHALMANYELLGHVHVQARRVLTLARPPARPSLFRPCPYRGEGSAGQTPRRATPRDLTRFHTDDYVTFLRTATADAYLTTPDYGSTCACTYACVSVAPLTRTLLAIGNMTENGDNPVFDGLFEFCRIYAGGTCSTSLCLSLPPSLAPSLPHTYRYRHTHSYRHTHTLTLTLTMSERRARR